MKVQITKSELYPWYTIDERIDNAYPVKDIPDDKITWITKVTDEWEQTQDYLEDLYGKKSI